MPIIINFIFRPNTSSCHLWDLGTDHYLHFPVDFKIKADYCAWFVDFDYWEGPNGWNDWKYIDDNLLSSVCVGELLLFPSPLL